MSATNSARIPVGAYELVDVSEAKSSAQKPDEAYATFTYRFVPDDILGEYFDEAAPTYKQYLYQHDLTISERLTDSRFASNKVYNSTWLLRGSIYFRRAGSDWEVKKVQFGNS